MRDLRPVLKWSGRKDLNLRPPGPEPGALARLRYAPNLIPYFPTVYAGLRASATIRLEAKTKPLGSFCSPAAFEGCYLDSEFVAQCELHHARLGREPGEIPERRAK